MQSVEKKIEISPIAYIKSLMYFQRFTNEHIEESKFRFAYGLFLGYIEDNIFIEDFFPIKDFDKEYIVFKEYSTIFEKVDELNKENYDAEYPSYILGWARNSLYDDLDPTIIDKQNQLFFQTSINPESFFWLFSLDNLAISDGISIYAFGCDTSAEQSTCLSINISSELKEIKYSFSKDSDLDELIQLAIDIEEKRKNKEVLIKGLEEK